MTRSVLFKAALACLATIAVLLALTLAGTSTRSSGAPHDAGHDDLAQLISEIRGADQNQDGIRDDVEHWIVERYGEVSSHRKALLQLAADYQSVLLTAGDRQKSRNSLIRLSESLGCVRYELKSNAEEAIVRFKAVVLDTDVRVRVWLKAYERLKETGVAAESHPQASDCRFSI